MAKYFFFQVPYVDLKLNILAFIIMHYNSHLGKVLKQNVFVNIINIFMLRNMGSGFDKSFNSVDTHISIKVS